LNTAGLGDLNFAALDSFVEGDKRGFAKGLTGIANDREQHEIAALDGSEHPEWTAGCFRWPARRLDLIALLKCSERKQRCRRQPERAESLHVSLLRRLKVGRPVTEERRSEDFLQ
jgi:hypothetical protein